LRQGLFAIVLVLAAFAGGALINGPGMVWIQAKVQDLVESGTTPTKDESEVDPVAVEETNPEPGPLASSSAPSAASIQPVSPPVAPMAPPPPFQPSVAESSQPAASAADTGSLNTPPSVAAPRGPTLVSNLAEPSPTTPISDLPPKDAQATPATPEPPKSLAETTIASGSPTSEEWPDAPGSAPAAAIPPSQGGSTVDSRLALAVGQPAQPANPAPIATPPGSDLESWDQLQQRMKDLGIVRFWFEGEVGGRARYRCVVPVIGDQVISQHFEAEGDTVFAAARAALRRVALWRAAQEP
jgi:hypothetical protein